MINYQDKVNTEDNSITYVRVKWNKTEIGRIYKESGLFHYRPRGCQGMIRSEEFKSLRECKNYLEGKV